MRTPGHLLGLVGAIVVSVLVLALFGAICVLLFLRAIPAESRDAALIMLGALAGSETTVVCYWLGSSLGSMHKTEILKDQGKAT